MWRRRYVADPPNQSRRPDVFPYSRGYASRTPETSKALNSAGDILPPRLRHARETLPDLLWPDPKSYTEVIPE